MCPLSRCDTPLSSNPATAHRHTPLWAAKQASTPAIPFSVPPITLDFSSSSADSEPDTPLSEFEPRADSDTSRPLSIFPLTLTSRETRRKGRKKKKKCRPERPLPCLRSLSSSCPSEGLSPCAVRHPCRRKVVVLSFLVALSEAVLHVVLPCSGGRAVSYSVTAAVASGQTSS
jgi:hypothetical protein